MTNIKTTEMTLITGTAAAGTDSAALDQALKTLKTYDWGADRNALDPIDKAIVSAQGNPAALKSLEKRLADILAGGISRSAQDYVCRKLRVIGTGQSVRALASLLRDEETSHIARYALERIPGGRATRVLRNTLPKVGDKLKPGIISSLGIRRDKDSISTLSKLMSDSDIQVARAAALSLGLIGTSEAAKELSKFAKKASGEMKIPAGDACLACAEQLLADGKKTEAVALYKQLQGSELPKNIKTAAVKGILTAATKS